MEPIAIITMVIGLVITIPIYSYLAYRLLFKNDKAVKNDTTTPTTLDGTSNWPEEDRKPTKAHKIKDVWSAATKSFKLNLLYMEALNEMMKKRR